MENLGCNNIDSAMSYCYFFGAYSIGYSIKDCVNILHTPSGCQRRILYLWSMHDNSSNYRLTLATNIIDKDVIFGTESKLEQLVKDTISRYKPRMISIISSCAPEIIGMDYDIALSEIKNNENTKILPINSAGFKGDFYDGFKNTLYELIKSLPNNLEKERDTVNIIGYFYSRCEDDEISNINELKRIVEGLGLKVNTIFMSGCEYEKLEKYSKSEYNILFPYGMECKDYLENINKQKSIVCNMPIGIKGTIEFINKVAEETNHKKEAKEFIEKELKRCIPKIEPTIHIMNGKKVCIIADEQYLYGLLNYILELGVEPRIIGCYNENCNIKDKVQKIIRQNTSLKYEPIIIEKCTRENVKRIVKENYVDFCIGSSIEARDLEELRIPIIEFAFPLFEKHYNFESPILGFNGALNIDTIIFNVLNRYSMRRTEVKKKLESIKSDEYFLFKWIEKGGKENE